MEEIGLQMKNYAPGTSGPSARETVVNRPASLTAQSGDTRHLRGIRINMMDGRMSEPTPDGGRAKFYQALQSGERAEILEAFPSKIRLEA